jgi:hypothetical protein
MNALSKSSRTFFAPLAVLVLATVIATVPTAEGAEIVPSFGLTRSADSDDTKSNVGLALRSALLGEQLQSEIGVSYRKEEYYNGALETKVIPLTASLLLRPVPALHADAGVGWYHTNYDYENPLIDDETDQQFGVHVGGGFQVPLAPRAAIDLTGRYVFLKDQESKLVPETFDPDFWSMALGMAIKF